MIFPNVPCLVLFESKNAPCLNNTALDIYEPSRPGALADAIPSGEIWFIIAGHIHNGDNVQRACTVTVRDQGTINLMSYYTANVAAGGWGVYPNTSVTGLGIAASHPIPHFPGERLRFYWAAGGASAGGTCYYSYRVVVYKISDLRKAGYDVEAWGYQGT